MDLPKFNAMLTKPVRAYAKSLYIDTRLKQDLYKQHLREPRAFNKAIKYLREYHKDFPEAVRSSGPSTYNIFIAVQNTPDDLERMGLWVDYLDRNKV